MCVVDWLVLSFAAFQRKVTGIFCRKFGVRTIYHCVLYVGDYGIRHLLYPVGVVRRRVGAPAARRDGRLPGAAAARAQQTRLLRGPAARPAEPRHRHHRPPPTRESISVFFHLSGDCSIKPFRLDQLRLNPRKVWVRLCVKVPTSLVLINDLLRLMKFFFQRFLCA